MIRKIITYPFIAIGAIGCLFFGAYTGTLIPYSSLFAILSLALAVGAWYLSWYTPASKQKAAMEQTIQEEIQELKKDGYKIDGITSFTETNLSTNNNTANLLVVMSK